MEAGLKRCTLTSCVGSIFAPDFAGSVLPVGDPGFQHVRIVAVVKPDALQIQPALKHIFIGVDNQRPRPDPASWRRAPAGGVDILFIFRRQ